MQKLEERTQVLGRELLKAARGMPGSGLFSQKLMEYAMGDGAVRTALFRFVDVFPMLRTGEAVDRVLKEYLEGVKLPRGLGLAMGLGGVMKRMQSSLIRSQIDQIATRFMLQNDANRATGALKKNWLAGIAFSIDLLGEACVSDAEAGEYRRKYSELVGGLPGMISDFPRQEILERDHLGEIPRGNVSVKISSLSARIKGAAFEESLAGLMEGVRPIVEAARKGNVLINFDMEQYALKDLTIELFMRACEKWDFEAGIALQAYLKSAEGDAERLIAWARRTGRVVTVRLIKGAYWDYEGVHAEMMNWPVPVWERKWETDACFERVTELLVAAAPRRKGEGGIKLAVGSHNVRSIAHAMAAVEGAGLPAEGGGAAMEVQMLKGMGDELKGALVARGVRVREYVPMGEMVPGMAYLVRRLLENTSNESWLRAGFAEGVSDDALMERPGGEAQRHKGTKALRGRTNDEETNDYSMTNGSVTNDETRIGHRGTENTEDAQRGIGRSWASGNEKSGIYFLNEPLRDFSDGGQREGFARAVGKVRVPRIEIVREVGAAGRAVEVASGAVEAWRGVGVVKRAGILRRAAEILAKRRDEVAAMMVVEAKKTWGEADGDVCEAIDFLRFYAAVGERVLLPRRLTTLKGETNVMVWEPRGVAVVISPWNFPLAIPCGMTSAALVGGNAVILKPAEQTPAVARALVEILWEAGVPKGALQFLPGEGETVGAALVGDGRVGVIAFTGSKEVGRAIMRAAAGERSQEPEAGSQKREISDLRFQNSEFVGVPHVVCEMGGKNAIIVDETADLDEAVVGIRQSAFGYAGQKCSACSRLIVVDGVYEALMARLVEAVRSMKVGDTRDPAVDMGEVIDKGAAEKVWRYIGVGMGEGRVVYPVGEEALRHRGTEALRGKDEETNDNSMANGRRTNDEMGARRDGSMMIVPHIFAGVEAGARIWREEIFGPVLAVMKVKDVGEAIAAANGVGYRLTGGVYSRSPAVLRRVAEEFRVGNLYINRGITGAAVGRQPFGGTGWSGLGTKAGGEEYVKEFVTGRVVTENVMRRGFAGDD